MLTRIVFIEILCWLDQFKYTPFLYLIAKRLASEALQDVRRSVGTLRSTQELPEFTLSLIGLVELVRGDTCAVELNIEGDEDSFAKQGLLALYRAAQEGLTNVQRHASASHIWIDLHFGEQEATLGLRDRTQAAIYAREKGWL